jgi:predicted DNA-binding transcriptional regulator AlpA
MHRDRIVSLEETAAMLSVSVRTLDRWEASGQFPQRLQIGPRKRGHRLSTIEGYLATCAVGNRGV